MTHLQSGLQTNWFPQIEHASRSFGAVTHGSDAKQEKKQPRTEKPRPRVVPAPTLDCTGMYKIYAQFIQ